MQFDDFRDLVFRMAREKGFSEFEIYCESGENFKVSVFQKEIDNYSLSVKTGLSFRGIYKGKMGYAFTEVLDEDAAAMLVDNARSNASVIESDDCEVIYSGSAAYPGIDGFDAGLAAVEADRRIELALNMEKLVLQQDARVKSVSHCSVGYFDGNTRIVNSKGLDLAFRSNGTYAVLVPVITDSDKMKTGISYRVTRNHSELNAAVMAKEAVDDALSYIGAGPVDSGKYRIAFKNEAAVDLLETFSGIFSADRVQKGLSLLKGKMGEVIGSQALTIIDDPLCEDGMGSAPFDAEGVATYRKEVVSRGVLATYLYNLKTASRDGRETTGNASKASYASPVDISPSNFFIKSGSRSCEEILEVMGNGLLITELQGLHSGANTVSGDFSLSARGFLVQNGKIERPVEQITVAGNFYSLLMNIEEVGNDLKFGMPSGGCFGSPTILVSGLSVAGK